MATVKLIRPIFQRGERVEAGVVLEVDVITAAELCSAGKAERFVPPPPEPVQPEEPAPPATKAAK